MFNNEPLAQFALFEMYLLIFQNEIPLICTNLYSISAAYKCTYALMVISGLVATYIRHIQNITAYVP